MVIKKALKKFKKSKKAFSLLELIIALVLIGIIIAILSPYLKKMFSSYATKGQAEKVVSVLRNVAEATLTYKVESGSYPTDVSKLLPKYLDSVPKVKFGDTVVSPTLSDSYQGFGNTTKYDEVVVLDNVPKDVCQEAEKIAPDKVKCDTSGTTNKVYYLVEPDIK